MPVGIALTLLPSLPGMIVGVAAVTVGFFVARSVASGWVGRMATESKGHAASLYLRADYLGSSCLGSAGGWFWTAQAWPAVAVFNVVPLALAMVAAALLVVERATARRLNHKVQKRSPTPGEGRRA